eukprot:gene16072-21827_t
MENSMVECGDILEIIGWEYLPKHFFILSASGKPIFSNYGDEQDMVTTFGLLQAVVSIVEDSGDELKCISVGKRKIVYLLKQSIYFICMYSSDEPEAVIAKQLQFLYHQILLVLTGKVHDIFRNNPSADVRQLLGADTTRLMKTTCQSHVTPPFISFHAIRSFTCYKELREDIKNNLRSCVENSGAALGLLLYKDAVVGFFVNPLTQLSLGTNDLALMVHFVANSSTFNRSSDQHWVPICMPDFNSTGYLQAYVSNLRVPSTLNELLVDFSLILVAVSPDPAQFKDLHTSRIKFEEDVIKETNIADRLIQAYELQKRSVDKYLEPSLALHYLFKYRPVNIIKGCITSSELPVQYINSSPLFPINNSTTLDSIMVNYQRLSLSVRRGSSSIESTMFSSLVPMPNVLSSQHSKDSNLVNSELRKFPMKACINRNLERTAFNFDSSCNPSTTTESLNPVITLASSDHAFAHKILSTGFVLVALVTFDSELYVTYPSTISVVDATSMADFMLKSLKADLSHLFLTPA